MELKIPKYLSIKNYQKVNSLEHLSSTEKIVEVLAILGDIPSEQLKKKHSKDLPKMYDKVTEALFDVGYEYYPIIEVEGVLYGYEPITKMTLGEYIDLENLTKKPLENLDQIMAILYRPVLKHRFKSLEFKIKNGLRLGQGKLEDVLKYYTVEEYDSNKRYDYAEIFQDIPVAYALGALSFFLQTANIHLRGIEIYSYKTKTQKEKKEMLNQMAKQLSVSTGDGLLLFITSLQHPSFRSQEISLSRL